MTRASINTALIRCALAHRHVTATHLAQLNLHPGQERLLMCLWHTDGQPAVHLARALNVTPPTITNMLHKLEQASLVTRHRDPNDQRVTTIHLTDAGRALQSSVERLQQQIERRMLQNFAPQERRAFHDYLERATRALTTEETP